MVCPSDEGGLGGPGLGEVRSPCPRWIGGARGGPTPSTPSSGIEMPWGPVGSLGGDIDPSRTVAL